MIHALLLLLHFTSAFNIPVAVTRTPSVPFLPVTRRVASSRLASKSPVDPDVAQVSRRNVVLRGAVLATGVCSYGIGATPAAWAYNVDRVDPNERETYAEAQKGAGPRRVLWVGVGDMKSAAREKLFRAGSEVVAVDLLRPDAKDLSAATAFATENGYQLSFEQGNATKLKFEDGSFDAVVCSFFLCQDFDPAVVVSEIRRVLKPGGRFGFYEHEDNINKVIVDKVFGEQSVIRVQSYPQKSNIIAGVVRKV